jgi:predicted dienelactone hydrolase
MNTPMNRTMVPALLAVSALISGTAQAQVGMSSWQAGTLPVTLVYPTNATSQPQRFGAFQIDVALNAPALGGRHRLIVLSHGTGGSAMEQHALAAALARAGFVVAQPLHQGDNWQDTSQAGPASFERRPKEVIQVIDALSQDPNWSARLDLSQVGVHGMSAGGVTGLSLAGGQWRLLNLVRHCSEHMDSDAGFCFNGANDGAARAARQQNFASARGVPEAQLPPSLSVSHGGLTPTPNQPDPRPDPRVAAVSLMVPVAALFSAESLARIRIPVAVVSGELDTVLLPRFHAEHVLSQVPTARSLARLPAGHFDVLMPWPESVAHEVAALQVRGGLPTPGFDPALLEAAHAKIVAFHRQHLNP